MTNLSSDKLSLLCSIRWTATSS